MEDRYHRLGLRRNPFVADPVPGVSHDLWVETGLVPPRSGEIVQLIGPRGAGKTTQLLHWQRHLGGVYRHVLPGRHRWARLPIADRIYWDEADRVPPRLLQRATKTAAKKRTAIAIATHVDLTPALASLRLSIRTHHLGDISATEVVAWAARRIADTQLDGVTSFSIDRDLAESVAAGSEGSWRVVGDQLHVWTAQRAMER